MRALNFEFCLSALGSLALLLGSSSSALANDSYGHGVEIFAVGSVVAGNADTGVSANGWRIPAITALGNGVLVASADVRYMGTGWSDIVAGSNLRKTKIATIISTDGGATWSSPNILHADVYNRFNGQINENSYYTLSTDSSLVYDPVSGNLLAFGLQNNVNLGSGGVASGNPDKVEDIPSLQYSDFIMFTSRDGGKTWDHGKSLYSDILGKINSVVTSGKRYSMVFQGPSGAMFYNNKIYVPIQAWASTKDTATINPDTNDKVLGKGVSTSGFMVSADGGETWRVSSMLLPDPGMAQDVSSQLKKSSESNLFHLNGKIMMAVRNEGMSNDPSKNGSYKLRQVFQYDEANDAWIPYEETFLPHDVARVETSSHNLSESVYMVGFARYYYYDDYSLNQGNTNRRRYTEVMTNTGISFPISSDVSESYTSITHDDDNIYVLYEGDLNHHNILLRTIDWKSKEYATLPTQTLNRAKGLLSDEMNFAKSQSKAKVYAGTSINLGAEFVFKNEQGIKVGSFISHKDDLSKDISDTENYQNTKANVLLGYDGAFANNDNIFIGIQYDRIKYDSGTKNDVTSVMAGYSLNHSFDYFNYDLAFNVMLSNNEVKRDSNRGLGREASFSSTSIALLNKLTHEEAIMPNFTVGFSAGLENVFFSHNTFTETGGVGTRDFGKAVGANNATVYGKDSWSHELFVAVNPKYTYELGDGISIDFALDARYAYNLAKSEDWRENFKSMDIVRQYQSAGEVYSGRNAGFMSSKLSALWHINEVDVGAEVFLDSIVNKDALLSAQYNF